MFAYIGVIIVGFSWILPNSSRPWTSFWQESTAFLGLLFIQFFLVGKSGIEISRSYFLFLISLLIILLVNFIIINNKYYGDYVVGLLYMSSFFLSFIIGGNDKKIENIFFISVLFFSILSGGITIAQWLQIDLNRLYFLEHPHGTRSFANIGQANHLGTILVWGIVSTFFLESQRKISMHSAVCIAVFLTVGVCLTQSRTAFLQIIACCLILSYFKFSKKINISVMKFLITPIFIVFLSYFISIISTKLGLSLERGLGEMAEKGGRLEHWNAMLDAVRNKPWTGYGWLHSAKAQVEGTNAQGTESIFQYSHNFLLDLILWFGIPSALIIGGIFSLVIMRIVKKITKPLQVYAFCAFSVFLIHSLLEYPFAYLYLLIPAGVFLGLSTETSLEKKVIKISNKIYWIGISLISMLALILVRDYWEIEGTSTSLRMQYNGIGINLSPPENSKIIILDQASSFINSSYKRPSEDIRFQEAKKLSVAAERFGTQRILFHNAIAYAFIGDEYRSKWYLYTICRINSLSICKSTKIQWKEWQDIYPETIGRINFPMVEKLLSEN